MSNSFFGALRPAVRRKVFVSYHHEGDQSYYDLFSLDFHNTHDVLTDNSLERRIDSAEASYVMRRIREHHLSGRSCTIVLCGRDTPKRNYVDWEIEALFAQGMGLVGIMLPTIAWFSNGGTAKPYRLQDNIDTWYAEWVRWDDVAGNPAVLAAVIERANAKPGRLIVNTRAKLGRNG